jgi:hypothetical protein
MLKAHALPSLFSAPALSRVKRPAKSNQLGGFWFFGSVSLIMLLVVVLMSYLLGVNSYTSRGYEIQKAQAQLSQLIEENKKLSLKTAEVSSIMKIQVALENSNFVPSGAMQFLEGNQYTYTQR